MLIAGVIDQPCLRIEEGINVSTSKNSELHKRPQVCTFCLADAKNNYVRNLYTIYRYAKKNLLQNNY